MNLLRPELALMTGATLWGIGWIPVQMFAGRGLVGMQLILACYGLLSLVSLPLILRQRRAWWGQRFNLLAIGACGGWATAGLVSALSEGDVMRAMLLFYLAPVWALLGGWLLLGERLDGARIGAVLLAMLGIGLTLGASRDSFQALHASDALALSAGLAFALNNIATRSAQRVPLTSKALVAFLGSALFGALFCLFQGRGLPPMSAETWGLVALFGAFWLVSMGAAQYGFSHVEASRGAVLALVELIAAVLSAAAFGEREIGLREWLGGALVLAAAFIAARPPRPVLTSVCEVNR
jgi:drug/metabolite transporter (DMT)-like permease